MRTSIRTWRIVAQVLGLGLLVAVYSPHPVADACSIAGPPTPASVLGLNLGRLTPGYTLPANAAGLEELGGERFSVAGIELSRVPEGTTSYEVSGRLIAVSDTPDLVAPTLDGIDAAVRAEETACSGCAYGGVDASTLTLTVRASDDTAPFEQLSIAIYLGETAEAAVAAAASAPDFWALEDADGRVWVYLAADDPSAFVVVRVFDQAGNASALSEPSMITR